MPGPDGSITQAGQVTLVKGRIRYNRAQVRERATELLQALHVLRTSMPTPTMPSSATSTL